MALHLLYRLERLRSSLPCRYSCADLVDSEAHTFHIGSTHLRAIGKWPVWPARATWTCRCLLQQCGAVAQPHGSLRLSSHPLSSHPLAGMCRLVSSSPED